MAPQFGYLLPTRERVMEGRPETGSLLELAARAESLGFDSVWVGDSLLARPRHDPLTLLAAVAARTRKAMLGTAVFLPHSIRSARGGSYSGRASPATCPIFEPNLPLPESRSRAVSAA
jgi:hypothetical protein